MIEAGQLYAALNALSSLIKDADLPQLEHEATKLASAYGYMIQFFMAGTADPQRDSIYNGIVDSLYTLADKAVYSLATKTSPEQYYITRKVGTKQSSGLEALYALYTECLSRLELYSDAMQDCADGTERLRLCRELEAAENSIFNYVWTRFPLSNPETGTLQAILCDKEASLQLRTLIVAALFLSLCKFYQESLLALLLSLYLICKSPEIKMPALCCAIIAMLKHDTRAAGSPKITKILSALADRDDFCRDARAIFLLLIRSQDTERINQRMRDEIMPGLMKISPTILQKIKGKADFDPTDIDNNPEWQKMMEDSGLAKKMEEFNEMQIDGSDVFMGTFSRLKSYPFFMTISNWFRPFHNGCSCIVETFGGEENPLLNIVNSATFLCDSDKYSFCLSLKSLPEQQRQLIASQFDQQNAAIEEIKKAAPPDAARDNKAIANSFVQNLFRFIKLGRYRSEFFDPFATQLDFLSSTSLSFLLNDGPTLTLIAEYYLKNQHYSQAISYLEATIAIGCDIDPKVRQKIGFCHQSLKEYDKALQSYLEYDIYEPDSLWNLRHIASCYRAKGNLTKALSYYRKAGELSPENITINLNIAHCLLELGNTEEALKAYFKVDYYDTAKHRALRPIAWCAFQLGNYSLSRDYYAKIADAEEYTPHDFMNMGHLALCQRHYEDALARYRQSIKAFGGQFGTFLHNFNADKQYLTQKGISDIELRLICDSLFNADK